MQPPVRRELKWNIRQTVVETCVRRQLRNNLKTLDCLGSEGGQIALKTQQWNLPRKSSKCFDFIAFYIDLGIVWYAEHTNQLVQRSHINNDRALAFPSSSYRTRIAIGHNASPLIRKRVDPVYRAENIKLLL